MDSAGQAGILICELIYDIRHLAYCQNSERLMCRKIWCDRHVSDRVNSTEFGRIVLNFLSGHGLDLGHLISHRAHRVHREKTKKLCNLCGLCERQSRSLFLIFATNFVDSSAIRTSREVFPIKVRSPEIGIAGLQSYFDILAIFLYESKESWPKGPDFDFTPNGFCLPINAEWNIGIVASGS